MKFIRADFFVHSTAGEDYTNTSTTVVFPPAETSQVVMVPILPDDIFEGAEQFTARLSLPAGQSGVVLGANTATVEITDEEDSRPFLRLHDKNILPLYLCISQSSCDSGVRTLTLHCL